MTTPTPETVTLETVEEYIRTVQFKAMEEPMEYYNDKTTQAVRDFMASATKQSCQHTNVGRYVPHLNYNPVAEYWQFYADKAGLKIQDAPGMAHFIEFFDIDIAACLIENVRQNNEYMKKFAKDIWADDTKLIDVQRRITDAAAEQYYGYVLHNRKGTLVFRMSYPDALTSGYFHYFDVFGESQEIKRAYYFMLKHMDYSEARWKGG